MKHTTRERIDATITVLLIFCALPPLLQLVAIPSSEMVKIPRGLVCDFYGYSRAGWGCSRLGGLATNPAPLLLAVAASCLLFFATWPGRDRYPPIRYLAGIVLAQALLVCALAFLLRSLQVAFGVARIGYLLQTLPLALVCIASYLLLRFIRPERLELTPTDRRRQEMQGVSIELEVLERTQELRGRSRGPRAKGRD